MKTRKRISWMELLIWAGYGFFIFYGAYVLVTFTLNWIKMQ